jgi:hypothetical protein
VVNRSAGALRSKAYFHRTRDGSRIRGARGKRLLRQRGERVERPCAHLYDTGRLRRLHLRGHSWSPRSPRQPSRTISAIRPSSASSPEPQTRSRSRSRTSPSRTSPTRPTVFRHFCLSRDPRLGGSRMRLVGAVVRPPRAGSAHRPGYIHRRRRSRLSGQPGRSARHSRSGPARGITAGGATDRAVVAEPSMIHRRKLFWQTELFTTIMGECRFRRARTSPCWP